MNSKEKPLIPLNLAFRNAENIARKRSSKAWVMANILIPKPGRDYLFLCYAYLRWVDNFIDDKTKTFDEKKEFIEYQSSIISLISSGKSVRVNSNEEAYIYYFILFAIQSKKQVLIDELKIMIEAMKMDVCRLRNKGIFSDKELHHYVSLLNKSMFGLVHSFIFFEDNIKGNYKNLGEFLWYAGSLRDFYEDYNDGYINISAEDIKEYKIHLDNKFENIDLWLKDKIPGIINLLEREISILSYFPFKIRLFWSFGYPFYLHKILRIKMYGYSFKYRNKPSILKEIKTTIASLMIGTRTVFKILF